MNRRKKTATRKNTVTEISVIEAHPEHKARHKPGFFVVRPAGRTYLEVKVLYSSGKGKS